MKGARIDQFSVGQRVRTNSGLYGTIAKLHRSCRYGMAEIRPINGTAKVTRRLQYVERADGE